MIAAPKIAHRRGYLGLLNAKGRRGLTLRHTPLRNDTEISSARPAFINSYPDCADRGPRRHWDALR